MSPRRRFLDHPEFNASIERLYRAFEMKPPADRVQYWLDMPSPEFEGRCVAEASDRPVLDLSQEVFKHLAWHAMCWDSDHRATVCYFLPRILDEAIGAEVLFSPQAHVATVPLDMMIDVLTRSRWRQWPAEQRDALAELFTCVWRLAITDRSRDAAGWLARMLAMQFQPRELLSQWITAPDGAHTLADFLLYHRIDPVNLRIIGWKGWSAETALDDRIHREIIDWFTGTEVARRLERAFFESQKAEDQTHYSLAIDVIDALRNVRR